MHYKLLIYTFLVLSNISCTALPEDFEFEKIKNNYSENPQLITLESKSVKAEIGFIFYPGAFVDPHAYILWQDKLVTLNPQIKIFTVKMPANLAVLDAYRGYDVIEKNKNINSWIIAGHSLGGTMAAQLMSKQSNSFDALILIASYPANNALKSWGGAVLSIYADKDGLSTTADINSHKQDLPLAVEINNIKDFSIPLQKKTHYFNIPGGNHAQFGSYGIQAKDSIASISVEIQQTQLIEIINNFISII